MNAALQLLQPTLAHARVPDSSRPGSPAGSPITQWGKDVRRILCVRLDNLGDVLMTTPAFRALRHAVPGRHLTLLGSRSGVALAPFLSDIDEVIEYDAPWVANRAAHAPARDLRMARRLRQANFDAAVIFTVYSQNPLPAAMICHLAGIPRRLAHCRENPYALLTDWVRETEPQHQTRHEVERQLALVRRVGGAVSDTRMRFGVRESDRATLAARLDALGLDVDTPYIVLHPGATAASRRYPVERFAAVAAELVRETGYSVLITGDRSECALAAALRRAAGRAARLAVYDLAGELSLGELAALLERTTVLISNNSGPVHIASALGTPVVDLYALTNPQHTPWQTPHRVLFHDVPCRWCYRSVCPQQDHACLRGVAPADVVRAALELCAENRMLKAATRMKEAATAPSLEPGAAQTS